MKKINLRDYYPYYTQDMIVEVPDEVALLLREYMLLEEAYRIRTYRYKAFYSLDRDEGVEREILQKPLNPAEIWEQRQMTELIYKGLSKLPVKQRQRIYAHFVRRTLQELKEQMLLLFARALTVVCIS